MYFIAHKTSLRIYDKCYVKWLMYDIQWGREEEWRSQNVKSLNHHTRVGGNSWPQVSTLLGDWTSDSRTLHFTLRVDNDTSVVLEVQVGTILSSPWSSLSNDNSWHNLLSQFWLTLLDGGHDHVTSRSSWQSVQSSTETLDGKNVKVSGTRVVATVNDGADWQTQLSVSILKSWAMSRKLKDVS